MEKKHQRKAEATHLFFEMKKLRIKTEQKLKLVMEQKEKKLQESYLNKINRALKTLEKYM